MDIVVHSPMTRPRYWSSISICTVDCSDIDIRVTVAPTRATAATAVAKSPIIAKAATRSGMITGMARIWGWNSPGICGLDTALKIEAAAAPAPAAAVI